MGHYSNKVDPKGRALVPSRLKNQMLARFGERPDLVVAFKGVEPCLVLADRAEWFSERESYLGTGWLRRDAGQFRRLSAFAETCELDQAGRIAISASLRERAAIKDEILFVGCEDYIELWEPGRGAAVLDALVESAPGLLERLRDQSESAALQQHNTDGDGDG